MKTRLHMNHGAPSLSNALATASEGEALDLKESILFLSNSNVGLGNSNNRIKLLQQMVKEGLSATAQLEDQPLPSKADLSRWFPETPASSPTRLLISPRRPASARAAPPSRHVAHAEGSSATSSISGVPSSARPASAGACTAAMFSAKGAPSSARPASARTGFSDRSSITGVPSSTRPSSAAPASRRGLEAPGASVAFAAKAPRRTGLADVDDDKAEPVNTTAAMRAVLSEWMASYSEDEMAFASKAVFIEMRLRQALACSASIGIPNQFRCAIVCDAWERVVPFTGRLESMLKLLWSELLRCLFVDYTPNMVGAGAKAYAARTPFFVEAQRLRRVEEAAAVKMRAWEKQREQELMVVAERNKAINHTLGAWNRALGFSTGTKQDPAIAEQLSVLAGSLLEANSEAGEISRQASTEPRQRCRQAFELLTPEEQASFVLETALAAPSAADWLASRSHNESARTLAPMLSKIPKEEQKSLFDALAEALGLAPLRRSLPTESATAGAQAAAGSGANAGSDAAAAVSATPSLGSCGGGVGGASAAAKGGSALSRIQRSSEGKVLSQKQSLSPAQDTVLAHRTTTLAFSVGNVPASVLSSAAHRVPRQ